MLVGNDTANLTKASSRRMQRLVLISIMLATSLGCSSGEALDCIYGARETEKNPTPYDRELQPRGQCATLARDGSVTVQRDHLDDLYFTNGLGKILLPTGWVYVTSAGRTAPVLTFDNGPDYFEEGLARTIRRGKVGFINRDLDEVIPPTWDFAFPFVGGFALVCEGCRSRPVDGEHSEMHGGVWGYVNRSGEVVVPVQYERDSLPVPPPNH